MEGASVELKTSAVSLYFFRNILYMKGLLFLCGLFSFYHSSFALFFLAWKGLYWNELIASYDDESSWFYMFHGYLWFLTGWEIIDFPFCIAHWQKCQRCRGSVSSLRISIFKQIHFFFVTERICIDINRNFVRVLFWKWWELVRDYCEVTGLCVINLPIIVRITEITKLSH